MNIAKEKAELVEMFGIHFESLYHLPPLSARILGTLIIDGVNEGLTFESLVERLNASKSSVSTNLNLLQKIGKITYYTLAGDRKKYFKPSPLSEIMTNYIKIIDFEKKIIDKMLDYCEKTNSTPAEMAKLNHTKLYKEHVLAMENVIVNAIEKFKAVENINQN